jgi:hypothetical protein
MARDVGFHSRKEGKRKTTKAVLAISASIILGIFAFSAASQLGLIPYPIITGNVIFWQSGGMGGESEPELVNATLHIWNSGGELIYTSTVSLSGTEDNATVVIDLPHEGEFHWNYLACDDKGNCAFAETNRTVINENSGTQPTGGSGSGGSGGSGSGGFSGTGGENQPGEDGMGDQDPPQEQSGDGSIESSSGITGRIISDDAGLYLSYAGKIILVVLGAGSMIAFVVVLISRIRKRSRNAALLKIRRGF